MLKLCYSDWSTVFESHLQPSTLKSSEIYQEMWKKQINLLPGGHSRNCTVTSAHLSVSVSWPMAEGGARPIRSMTRRLRPSPPQS